MPTGVHTRMGEARFGHYRLEELIGRGGMGEVWRAYDERRGRVVALKLLAGNLGADAEFAARFRAESQLTARLRDAHIVPIHDFGEIDGRLYLDMRLVEGESLAGLLRREGALPLGRAVGVITQIAEALDAAHAEGLEHRDVKPSNILLAAPTRAGRSEDFAYLVDFGIARSIEGTSLTRTGTAPGTPGYMAPERIEGLPSDHRGDVYSLSCVLYECLTGQQPFVGEAFAQMWAHVNSVAPAPSSIRPELPRTVDAVLARGLAKRPDQRFDTTVDLAAAAAAATATAPPSATATAPPSAIATAPPSATATAPPSATATAPPSATATAPPSVTAAAPRPATATAPSSVTAAVPRSATAAPLSAADTELVSATDPTAVVAATTGRSQPAPAPIRAPTPWVEPQPPRAPRAEPAPAGPRRALVLLAAGVVVAVVATLLVVVLPAAIGRNQGPSGGSTGSAAVLTDVGVTDTTISLGVMTDTSGVFHNVGTAVSAGNRLWADDVNAAGGVCSRSIELEVVDHGYKAETAKTLYPQLAPKVLGMVQLLGSPGLAALKENLLSDNLTAAAGTWSSEVLNNRNVMMVGTTYDLEIINGLSYLQQQGLLKDGDTIGHLYIDGEYGGNGFKGTTYYGSRHNLTVVPAAVPSTLADMTDIVTGFRGAGVKVIVLTSTPTQTASALGANQALGLNVPVLGNNPTFDPALLQSPVAAALGALYVAASVPPFSSKVPKAAAVAAAYDAAYPSVPGNAYVQYGYAQGLAWQAVLTKACENGDLSRVGVQTALTSLTAVSTQQLTADLDFSSPGSPPARGGYLAKVDPAAEGGLTEVTPLFTAPEAAGYVAPHQRR